MRLVFAVCPYCHIGLTLDEWNNHPHVNPSITSDEIEEEQPDEVEDDTPRVPAPGWRRRKDGTRYWVDSTQRGKSRQEERETDE